MKTIITIAFLLIIINCHSQEKYITRTGHIYFISKTDAIDIDADNHQAGSIFNYETGEIVFAVVMKAFKFKLALAEDHFNEDYVESYEFPKSKFKGQILNYNNIDLTKDSLYLVDVKGELTIHGITKNIQKKGTIQKQGNVIIAKSEFSILLDDYEIKVPDLVRERVAKEIQIKINMEYKPYEK